MASIYAPEIKAQVIGDFALGLSKSAIAKKHGIPRTTVIGILAGHEPPVPSVSDMAQRERLGVLVYEYLVTGFDALIAQHGLAGDPAYLKQSSTSLPEIYKAIHGGVISVAQAIERGADRDDAEPGGQGAGALVSPGAGDGR